MVENDLATQETDPFMFLGKYVDGEHPQFKNYDRIIRRFDSPADCLGPSARDQDTVDLLQIDWNKVGTGKIAEVCVFRILRSLANTDDIIFWLEHHDFTVTGPTKKSPGVIRSGQDIVNDKDILGTWTLDRFRSERPSLLSFFGVELVNSYDVLVQLDQYNNVVGINAIVSTK